MSMSMSRHLPRSNDQDVNVMSRHLPRIRGHIDIDICLNLMNILVRAKSASPSSEVVGLDPPPSPTSPVVLRTRQSRLSSVLAEFRAERRRGVRLGCVREYGAWRVPGEGPQGGKLAAGGTCEASGRVAGAGGARSAAEGVVRARTRFPLTLLSSRCP